MQRRVILSCFDTSTNGIVASVRRRYPNVSLEYTSEYIINENANLERRLHNYTLYATTVSSCDEWDVRNAFYFVRMFTGARPAATTSKRLTVTLHVDVKTLKHAIMYTPLRNICLIIMDVFGCFIFFENCLNSNQGCLSIVDNTFVACPKDTQINIQIMCLLKMPKESLSPIEKRTALKRLDDAAAFITASVLNPQENISVELLPTEQSILYANRKITHVVMRATGANVALKQKSGACDAITFRGSQTAIRAAKEMIREYVGAGCHFVHESKSHKKDRQTKLHTDPQCIKSTINPHCVVLDGPNIARSKDGSIADMNDVFDAVQFFLRGYCNSVCVCV